MVICLVRDADLHMAQLMPLPLTVSCLSKIQICFTFLVLAHPDSPGIRAFKRVCVCVCVCECVCVCVRQSYWWLVWTAGGVFMCDVTEVLVAQEALCGMDG